jgi:hypothetical protein
MSQSESDDLVGGAGGAMALEEFDRPVNPISIRVSRSCQSITGTPRFSDPPMALHTTMMGAGANSTPGQDGSLTHSGLNTYTLKRLPQEELFLFVFWNN